MGSPPRDPAALARRLYEAYDVAWCAAYSECCEHIAPFPAWDGLNATEQGIWRTVAEAVLIWDPRG